MPNKSLAINNSHRAKTGHHNNYVHDRNAAQDARAQVALDPVVGGSGAQWSAGSTHQRGHQKALRATGASVPPAIITIAPAPKQNAMAAAANTLQVLGVLGHVSSLPANARHLPNALKIRTKATQTPATTTTSATTTAEFPCVPKTTTTTTTTRKPAVPAPDMAECTRNHLKKKDAEFIGLLNECGFDERMPEATRIGTISALVSLPTEDKERIVNAMLVGGNGKRNKAIFTSEGSEDWPAGALASFEPKTMQILLPPLQLLYRKELEAARNGTAAHPVTQKEASCSRKILCHTAAHEILHHNTVVNRWKAEGTPQTNAANNATMKAEFREAAAKAGDQYTLSLVSVLYAIDTGTNPQGVKALNDALGTCALQEMGQGNVVDLGTAMVNELVKYSYYRNSYGPDFACKPAEEREFSIKAAVGEEVLAEMHYMLNPKVLGVLDQHFNAAKVNGTMLDHMRTAKMTEKLNASPFPEQKLYLPPPMTGKTLDLAAVAKKQIDAAAAGVAELVDPQMKAAVKRISERPTIATKDVNVEQLLRDEFDATVSRSDAKVATDLVVKYMHPAEIKRLLTYMQYSRQLGIDIPIFSRTPRTGANSEAGASQDEWQLGLPPLPDPNDPAQVKRFNNRIMSQLTVIESQNAGAYMPARCPDNFDRLIYALGSLHHDIVHNRNSDRIVELERTLEQTPNALLDANGKKLSLPEFVVYTLNRLGTIAAALPKGVRKPVCEAFINNAYEMPWDGNQLGMLTWFANNNDAKAVQNTLRSDPRTRDYVPPLPGPLGKGLSLQTELAGTLQRPMQSALLFEKLNPTTRAQINNMVAKLPVPTPAPSYLQQLAFPVTEEEPEEKAVVPELPATHVDVAGGVSTLQAAAIAGGVAAGAAATAAAGWLLSRTANRYNPVSQATPV